MLWIKYGDSRAWTDDLYTASVALSQLSYAPISWSTSNKWYHNKDTIHRQINYLIWRLSKIPSKKVRTTHKSAVRTLLKYMERRGPQLSLAKLQLYPFNNSPLPHRTFHLICNQTVQLHSVFQRQLLRKGFHKPHHNHLRGGLFIQSTTH